MTMRTTPKTRAIIFTAYAVAVIGLIAYVCTHLISPHSQASGMDRVLSYIPPLCVYLGLSGFFGGLLWNFLSSAKRQPANVSLLENPFQDMQKPTGTAHIVILSLLTLVLFATTPKLLLMAAVASMLADVPIGLALLLYVGIPWSVIALLWRRVTL